MVSILPQGYSKIHTPQHKIILVSFFVIFSLASKAYGTKLAIKTGTIEETDDILKLSTGISIETNYKLMTDLTFWGRDYGPVKQRNYLWSVAYKIRPFSQSFTSIAMGGSVLYQSTTIGFRNFSKDKNESEVEWNLGVFLGTYHEIINSQNYHFGVYWESSIFPAGDAVYLLVTGRKQAFGLSFGAHI